jgi:hypothetical protein
VNVLLSVSFISISSTFAEACVLNGPRYQLASETVHWSLELSDGETCLRGVRFNNVVVDKLMIVSAPQTGHVMLQGTGFSYKPARDFQGRDFFSLMVSGAISKVPGSSKIEVEVSISNAGQSRQFSTTDRWNRSCTDSNGRPTANCSTPVASSAVNGSCGPANGVALSAAPSTGLCSLGAASTVTGSGPWHWSCAASNNGTTTLCEAPFTQTSGIIPPDRMFSWNPGMMSKGGVPNRTTICATLSPSEGDDSAAIQAKLDSCPSYQVIMLNPGTFIVNHYLLMHRPITLRGSGAGVTILKKTNGARGRTSQIVAGTNGIATPVAPGSYTYDTQPIIILGPSRWPGADKRTSQNLTADGQQGSFSVTIANGSGFAAGQFVLLDELSGASWQPTPAGFPSAARVWRGDRVAWNIHNPPQPGDDPLAAMSWFARTDRPTSEIKEIASVSGNTVTFTSPLSIGYRTSHTAQLTRYTTTGSQSTANSIHVIDAGLENLTTIGGADGAIRFENAAYSWAKNVEVTQWIGEAIAIDGSFRVEVRDSYIHTGSWPEPGGAGYAISFAAGSSEALIENNISIDVNKVMVFRSSGTGSVVAYNYTDDSWIYGTERWVEVGINASHMAGPHHVLFEANYSFNADSDYTHGNAIYLTFFRNWLSGRRRDFTDGGNIRTIGLAYGSWWDSFIGNVLGRPGQMSPWIYTDSAMSCDANGSNCTGNNANWRNSDVWKLGYDPERWSMNPDPQTLSTVIRDGNYDFLTNSQHWHNTPGGFAIPNSMYLTSKPAFFSTNQWPWIDPSTGKIYTLPAKARYDAGTPNEIP